MSFETLSVTSDWLNFRLAVMTPLPMRAETPRTLSPAKASEATFAPGIMVLKFHRPVNIIFADSKNIGGKAFGQIVLQLTGDPETDGRMIEYLRSKGLAVEEVNDLA